MLSAAEYQGLSALAIAEAVNARRLSAVEVARAALDLAQERDPRYHAFAPGAVERTLEQARSVDARVASGRRLPLAGVPCPIKDLSQVAGLPFGAGSAALAGNVAEVDDLVVRRLSAAGTLLVGKTVTPEFGLPCYTEPDVGPPTANPWDPGRSPGGSSGGAAAAVAAGVAPIAHASDGGGSIRIPASACGLVGLKATRGLIPSEREPGPGLGTDGVVSRTVRDTAAGLEVMAGGLPGDTYYAPRAAEGGYLAACDAPPERLRVGVLTEPVIAADAPVHPDCLAAVDFAAGLLESLGHQVAPAPVPFPAERWQVFQAVWSVGAQSIPLPDEAEPLLVPLTRWLRQQGRGYTGLDHARALAAVQALTREVAGAWDSFDVVLTPTLAQPPAPLGTLRIDADPAEDFAGQTRYTPWTSVYNLSGRPAISLPLYSTALPIGVMLGAAPLAEPLLLSLAAQLEQAAPWPLLPPGL